MNNRQETSGRQRTLSIPIPDVLRDGPNRRAEQFPGDLRGVEGEAQALCFSPDHVIKLISKQRDPQHRNGVVHGLKQAVLTPMGDEESCPLMPWVIKKYIQYYVVVSGVMSVL